MVTTPTPAETAQVILDVVVNTLGVKAGEDIPFQRLKHEFQKVGRHVGDIADGLECAHEQGWLNHDLKHNSFSLTAEGFALA